PRRISLRETGPTQRHRSSRRHGLRPRALPPPLLNEPRHTPHTVPQHGTHVPADGGCGHRPPHGGLPWRVAGTGSLNCKKSEVRLQKVRLQKSEFAELKSRNSKASKQCVETGSLLLQSAI